MKNILIVGVVFWLLFLNGYSQVKSWLANPQLASAPATVLNGAQRAIQPAATSQPQIRVIGGGSAPQAQPQAQPAAEPPTDTPAIVVITATPEPPTATPVVVVPQGLPEAAQMPTATPLPTVAPPISIDGVQYAMHTVGDRPCVYIYTYNTRVCWAPGSDPDDANVRFVVRAVKLGQIAGEPIPADG